MEEEKRYTIAATVDNEPGILARLVGLFSSRGYNIESLTVSTVNAEETLSRITIVTSGTPKIISQIEAQLGRLVPIHGFDNLTKNFDSVEKEVLLLKLIAEGPPRREALRIADIFGAKVSDTTLNSFIFILSGSSKKIGAFIDMMRSLGKTEIARSGVVALARGNEIGNWE
jgi:acetolactate synthase-1/3 small subunit